MKIKRRKKFDQIVVAVLGLLLSFTGIVCLYPLPDVESIHRDGGLAVKVPAIVNDLNERFIRGNHVEEN